MSVLALKLDAATLARLDLRKEERLAKINAEEMELGASISSIRKLQPSDSIALVREMRALTAVVEAASYSLYASFAALGIRDLDEQAEKTRRALELAAARAATMVALLERTPAFIEARKKILQDREG